MHSLGVTRMHAVIAQMIHCQKPVLGWGRVCMLVAACEGLHHATLCWTGGRMAYLEVLLQAVVLHILPAEAHRAAAAEGAVQLILSQKVRHDTVGNDVACTP